MNLIASIIHSWENKNGNVNTTKDLMAWINNLNQTTSVSILESSIVNNSFWYYDSIQGEVTNIKKSFFTINGVRVFCDNEIVEEQPMIFQPEIGYLGIICKEINGVLNFLMQAKIEPGNVNCVQISPTIQATKSNFTRVHGGKYPYYLELFEKSDKYNVIYDQIQSEQASRFYKKRNRNIIMLVEEEIELYPNFQWMTLGQIKQLMKVDNLVNMDTRTVLSGLPLFSTVITPSEKYALFSSFEDKALFRSIFMADPVLSLPKLYKKINRYKMLHEEQKVKIPLDQLSNWKIDEFGITCSKDANFCVRYYDIDISGREVQHWFQPLLKAKGKAMFGLLSKVSDNMRLFLVRLKPEIGSFDKIEIGPSIQWECTHSTSNDNIVDRVFRRKLKMTKNLMIDVVLSEEGGRFYHEENNNIIMEIDNEDLPVIPSDYFWADYATLNYLVQINNCLNIQLRNLLSLIDL